MNSSLNLTLNDLHRALSNIDLTLKLKQAAHPIVESIETKSQLQDLGIEVEMRSVSSTEIELRVGQDEFEAELNTTFAQAEMREAAIK